MVPTSYAMDRQYPSKILYTSQIAQYENALIGNHDNLAIPLGNVQ
jgi:hypothetical protein